MARFFVDFIQHRFDKRDVFGLARALRHRDDLARREAARALAELADQRAVPLLISAYADPRAKTAGTEIIHALGRIGGETAAQFLAEVYYQRPASESGLAALGALKEISSPSTEEAVRAGRAVDDIKSGDAERWAAGTAELRLLGPAGTRVLVAELEEWAAVKHHPDLSMAEAIEEERSVRQIMDSLRNALDALRKSPED
jgi:hypothetical protein